jgi:hypothetical protein
LRCGRVKRLRLKTPISFRAPSSQDALVFWEYNNSMASPCRTGIKQWNQSCVLECPPSALPAILRQITVRASSPTGLDLNLDCGKASSKAIIKRPFLLPATARGYSCGPHRPPQVFGRPLGLTRTAALSALGVLTQRGSKTICSEIFRLLRNASLTFLSTGFST